jgi:protein disulfide-isomerase A1
MFLKSIAKSLALVFAVATVAHSADLPEEDGVLVLTDANFDEAIAAHETLLVEFYAPWCGHCKSLAPEYVKAAASLAANDPVYRIAKVDATEHKELGERFGIQGFPTLKFFKGDDKAIDYDGGRQADDIVKWVIKKSGPAVQIIETAEELEALKAANDVVLFAVVDAVDGSARAILEKVANSDDTSIVVASIKTDISEDATAVNSAVLYKKFDEGKNVYSGEFEIEPLSAFLKKSGTPLLITFSQANAPKIFGGDLKEHMLIFVDTTKDYMEDLEKAMKIPSAANQGKLLHVIIPSTETRVVDYFGFKEEDFPCAMLVNMNDGMKKYGFSYKAEEMISKISTTLADDVAAFEESYFAGEVAPTLKSAEPVDDSADAVKVIVGKDFMERVIESDKDVLLKFYAPWCGHCKSLAPIYEEVAEAFADVSSIMIAKMDATENEIDYAGVDVKGFPTVLFFPANDKANPIQFSGDRDFKGISSFLKTNAQKFELNGKTYGAGVEFEDEEDVKAEEPAEETTDAESSEEEKTEEHEEL